MKKLSLSAVLFLFSAAIFSQTLFTYGNKAVTKDEFLRAYNKNKTTVTDRAAALREYLDLYIKFKLKVQAAKDMHFDTLTSLKNDLQNFRTQIEEGYLNDESQVNALVQQAFERSQKDIHLGYVLYPAKNYGDSAAVEKTHLSSKPNWNDLGFITVFNLPYEIENIVYGLRPGEESKPYHGKEGYYIFKNVEERKAVGKIKVAQILIALPENPTQINKDAAYKIADSVYHALLTGADFAEAAKNLSNDKLTYMSGGILPEFGIGKYDPVFEAKAFALQKNGDVTAPFETKYGYHIIKRLSRTEIPTDKNDVYQYAVKQQVQEDSRAALAKEKFLNTLLKKLNYKKNNAVNEDDLWKMTDSGKVLGRYTSQVILFSINNTNITIGDWLKFVKDYKSSRGLYSGETNNEIYKKFISITAFDNYKKILPGLNPEFKYQLEEFKEGNMLFEVMERNVWTKASADSAGLKNYYDTYKSKYLWSASADAILISCSNEKAANEAAAQIKNNKGWRAVAEANPSQIQVDSGRYELTQVSINPGVTLTEGMVTTSIVNSTDGTASFSKIIKMYPANQQRNFDEARGLVINDYQNFLEEKWIELLKKKYPVKVNESVFKSLL